MMQGVTAIFGFFVALAGFASAALSQSQLPIIPRTEAESARVAKVVAPTDDFSAPEPYEERPGGAATHFKHTNKDAFSQASANMSFERELLFKTGDGLFRKLWVSAPSSTIGSDGLGPLYNARSCQRCHLKDGRGHPPEGLEDSAVSMLIRLSVPLNLSPGTFDEEVAFETEPEPTYGGQLQDFGIPGHPAEGRIQVRYTEQQVILSDGETASLRKPSLEITELGYGPMHADVMTSQRIAPPMIGLGLLEAIPEEDILAQADPEDADGDGVSGHAKWVMSAETGERMLGRFGWKAGAATLMDQSAGAFLGDIGISTPLFPQGAGDCMPVQTACRTAIDGATPAHGDVEVSADSLDLVTFYARNLAVPARRDIDDPEVLRGKRVFYETGCVSCHTPKFVTHRLQNSGARAQPEQSFQLIWPYSDLLLHDMGEGLADGRPEGMANGREWRTPPLWGIGLTETVSQHTYFLHDGRARSLLEAILWHGGEAEAAREQVASMPREDRAALIRFLESL